MIRPRHASHITVGALALAALLLPALAAAQPSLAYDPPAAWTRGPYSSPVVYTAPGGAAELHVYDFQRYTGDATRRFRETRLFELIGIEHRETGTLEPTKYTQIQVQGAGAALLAIFVEQRGGVNRLHLRVAIPQSGAVALVDYHARTQDVWNRYLPAVDRVFASMRVGEAPAAPASVPRPTQGASGLYLATVRRMVFRATGGSEWTLNIEYYLLDPDGKLYHGWLPEAPGGGFLRFDYDEARRPGNSAIGTYTVSGNRVSLNVGLDKTTGTLLGPDELEIRGTKYKRSVK
jgi:hypothetical protein